MFIAIYEHGVATIKECWHIFSFRNTSRIRNIFPEHILFGIWSISPISLSNIPKRFVSVYIQYRQGL